MRMSRRMAIYSQSENSFLEGQKWALTSSFAALNDISDVKFYYYGGKLYAFVKSYRYGSSSGTTSMQVVEANINGSSGSYSLNFINPVTLYSITKNFSEYSSMGFSFHIARLGNILHIYDNSFYNGSNYPDSSLTLHYGFNLTTGVTTSYSSLTGGDWIGNNGSYCSDGSTIVKFVSQAQSGSITFKVSTNSTSFTTKTVSSTALVNGYDSNSNYLFFVSYDDVRNRFLFINPQYVVSSTDAFTTHTTKEYASWGSQKTDLNQALLLAAQTVQNNSNGTVLSCFKGFAIIDQSLNINRIYTNISPNVYGDMWSTISSDKMLISNLSYSSSYTGNRRYSARPNSLPGKIIDPSKYSLNTFFKMGVWNPTSNYFLVLDNYSGNQFTAVVSPRNPAEWSQNWLG